MHLENFTEREPYVIATRRVLEKVAGGRNEAKTSGHESMMFAQNRFVGSSK